MPSILSIASVYNVNRTVVFSNSTINGSRNSGFYNFETAQQRYFPYLIRDVTGIYPDKFAIITEDSAKFQLKIIDRLSFNMLDSISLPGFMEVNGILGTPFLQSYSISHSPCTNKISLCNGLPNAATVLEKKEGNSYQWQLSTDGGISFNNLENGPNYSGTNARQLNLLNLPDNMSGFQYRCVVDGFSGEPYLLAFENTWKPMQTGNWEDPANWSCGLLPGPTTDVIIFSGAVKINSDITIQSLQIMPGVQLELAPGVQIHLKNP